jgi:hypothetical protein
MQRHRAAGHALEFDALKSGAAHLGCKVFRAGEFSD